MPPKQQKSPNSPFARRKFKIHTVDDMTNEEYKLYKLQGRLGMALVVKTIFYICLVITMLGSYVYFQTIQSQLNTEYESLLGELNVMTSENVRLQVKLEAEFSNDAIEEIARELGMEELSNSSIEYITFNPIAQAEVMSKGNIFERIVDWCERAILKLQA